MRDAAFKVVSAIFVLSGCSSAPGGDAEDARLGQRNEALLGTEICPPGSNIIWGTPGPDTLQGTNGPDCILGGAGDDRIDGGNGNDVLVGGDGDDVLLGQNGNDRLEGEGGDDRLDGGNGNDVLHAGSGNDVVAGNNGDDDIDAGDGDDQVDGGDGNDNVLGGPGNDVLVGKNGNDRLEGGTGNDVLLGDSGNDTLLGGDGDDLIVRGGGSDVVSGGPGTDDCTGSDCEQPERTIDSCKTDVDCPSGERCLSAGICSACLSDAECDDGNICRTDSCQPAVGCRHPNVPDGTACADETVCNGNETCQSGACSAGTPLTCDDGLFCNGQETCEATLGCRSGTAPTVTSDNVDCTIDRCSEDLDAIEHAPNDAACSAGFFCAASGCQNIDECATGQANCDANATCTDHTPASYTYDEYSYSIPPFECRCNPSYEGDGHTCAPVCDPLTLVNGATRCVRSRPDQTVEYRKALSDVSWWGGDFVQDDEPVENYCGPTAVRNFLSWYDIGSDYDELASEMRTNTWDTLTVLGVVIAAGPLVGCVEPICWAIVTGEVAGNVVNAGTLPGDMRAAMDRRAPEGYGACISHEPDLGKLYDSLAAGNPVVFLESRGADNLHWAVATGLYRDFPGGSLRVRVANSVDRGWDQFVIDNSLSQVGDDARRNFLSALFGLNPYTSIRWVPRDQMNGEACP